MKRARWAATAATARTCPRARDRQGGAFTPGNANVRVHVLLLLGAVPNSTLPAKSVPTMLAPAPQSGPSVGGVVAGVVANDAVDHSNTAVAATVVIALTAKVFRRM